jgi:membrane associated rhomboid family serine protease
MICSLIVVVLLVWGSLVLFSEAYLRMDVAGFRFGSRLRRRIVGIGMGIAVAWLVVGVVAIAKVVPGGLIAPFTLGDADGLVPLQLFSYSFIHLQAYPLLLDLVWLAALVNLCARCLNPVRFLRLYSLGAVGGGACHLAVSWLTGEQEPLVGGTFALLTLLGALAYLEPRRRVFILGEPLSISFSELPQRLIHSALFVLLMGLVGYAGELGQFDAGLRTVLTWHLELVILTIIPFAVRWTAISWVVMRGIHIGVLLWEGGDYRHPLLYTPIIALAAGVVYAVVERLWQRGSGYTPRDFELRR